MLGNYTTLGTIDFTEILRVCFTCMCCFLLMYTITNLHSSNPIFVVSSNIEVNLLTIKLKCKNIIQGITSGIT